MAEARAWHQAVNGPKEPLEGRCCVDPNGTPTPRRLSLAAADALDAEIGRLPDGVEQLGSAKPLLTFAGDSGTGDARVVSPVVLEPDPTETASLLPGPPTLAQQAEYEGPSSARREVRMP